MGSSQNDGRPQSPSLARAGFRARARAVAVEEASLEPSTSAAGSGASAANNVSWGRSGMVNEDKFWPLFDESTWLHNGLAEGKFSKENYGF